MTKIEIATNLIEKYIEISLKTGKQYSKHYLATVLYNEHPDLFNSKENARSTIRYALNANGRQVKTKEDLAKRFALIPEAIKEVETTEPFIIPTTVKNSLVIADIHGRFYNKKAFEIAINYGIQHNCDSVIIDGDFVDFYGESRFDKNPSISIIFEEQEWAHDILSLLQDTFGYVVLKEGNHDIRRERHIARLAASKPELMEYAKYSDYMFFDGCHVNFVEDYRHIVYGKLNIIHGHEYYGGGGIHVAYNRLNKAFDNVMSAHSHKPQSVIKPTINGHILGSWALACLCDLNPRYSPKNDWSNGFARIDKDSNGEFSVDNRVIYGNKTFSV